jgi:hypothetical protein
MKHLIRIAVAIVAAMSLSSTAIAQECVPLEPKQQTGSISLVHEGQSVATTIFEEGGCTWPSPSLNGTDGLVLDTTGMEGSTGKATATLPAGGSVIFVTVNAYFLDANCTKIANSDVAIGSSLSDTPSAQSVAIPPTAKFFVASSTVANATNNVTVTLNSDGKDCVEKIVKKKKKKKKKRR